eukprot:2108763-Rhodomonas_salina.1
MGGEDSGRGRCVSGSDWGVGVLAGALNDVYGLDVEAMAWREVVGSGSAPRARWSMGLAADEDGNLYVFGGTDGSR